MNYSVRLVERVQNHVASAQRRLPVTSTAASIPCEWCAHAHTLFVSTNIQTRRNIHITITPLKHTCMGGTNRPDRTGTTSHVAVKRHSLKQTRWRPRSGTQPAPLKRVRGRTIIMAYTPCTLCPFRPGTAQLQFVLGR